MSGTRQTQFTVSGQSTDWKDPDAARVYIERIMEPVFKRVRNTVNQLARDWVHVTSSQFIDPKYGLVFVDATAGAVALTIPAPTDIFHPLVVVKTDASGNSVTVQVRGGANISGVATDVISAQWGFSGYEADETQYVKVSTGNLVGDVTGSPGDNTVSFLQNILLTIGTPTKGDVLMYDGTQITPTPLQLRAFQVASDTVGLWLMDQGGSTALDQSGNGNNLTAEAGQVRASRIWPGPGGAAFLFDGATKLSPGGIKAVLQLTGAMTFAWIGVWSDLPTAVTSRTVVAHSATGETSDTNFLYAQSVDINNQQTYFSEHGAGVNDAASVNTFFPRGGVHLSGFTRTAGGVVTAWQDGVAIVPDMGTITMPTDGSNGTFRIGGDDGGTNFFTGAIKCAVLANTAWDSTRWVSEYNYTMGRVFGFR